MRLPDATPHPNPLPSSEEGRGSWIRSQTEFARKPGLANQAAWWQTILRMAEPFQTDALTGVSPNAPVDQPAFSAFGPDKAAWKELPGYRYTAEELRAMEENWKDMEILEPLEPVYSGD